MKRGKVFLFITVMVCLVVLFVSSLSFAEEKKVWGKKNIWAKELTESLTALHGELMGIMERALQEELGDPDTFSELKEKLERDFNPELIPETPEEVENFATNFVSWIIDTYHYLKQEWLADENLIEEIKKVTVERMSSWSRCPQALAPKLWEGWRIQALSPVDLGIEFDIGSYGKLALFAIHENGPVFDAEVFDGENPSKKIGDLRDIYEKIFFGWDRTEDGLLKAPSAYQACKLLTFNGEDVSEFTPEDFTNLLWTFYPGDRVELVIEEAMHQSPVRLLFQAAKRDKWLVLPEEEGLS